MNVHAIILDYGNVLSLPQDAGAIAAMAGILEAPVAAFEKAYWQHRTAYDESSLAPEEYWHWVARLLSRNHEEVHLDRLIELDCQSWAHPRQPMVQWAEAIRAAGVRTAVLSNMPVTLRTYLDRFCPWMPAFDHRTFSCDLRLGKPAPGVFLDCLRGLGAEPAETLFLDDREENVSAARALGMHAVRFDGPEQAQQEINGRYALPVPIVANPPTARQSGS